MTVKKIEREAAIQALVARKVKAMGLHEFEPQAQLAALNQFNREPTSAHRAIEAGVACADRYRREYMA